YGRERQLAAVLQSRTATDIEAYRNEGHNIPGIIGQRWQEKGGKFLYHFLPTLRENQSSEPAEMTQQLQAYFEFVANLWLAFVPEPYKSKFPRDFSFPVTVPFSYIGELPVELEGGVPSCRFNWRLSTGSLLTCIQTHPEPTRAAASVDEQPLIDCTAFASPIAGGTTRSARQSRH